jgi:microcystin-dependent protein
MTALDDLKNDVTALQAEMSALSKQVVIVGTIVPYGGESEPEDGWLLCDGRPLAREEYEDLYGVIGVNFGAPDATHFNLPDLRGRFVRGVDNGPEKRDPDGDDRVASAPGGAAGRKVGSMQQDALQGHCHGTNAINQNYSTDAAKGLGRNTTNRNLAVVQGVTSDPNFGDARISMENRPKNVYINWIIYAGV